MGKTFGIVGRGAIGRRLAERLLFFGTNTVYYDPVKLSEEDEEVLDLKSVLVVISTSFRICFTVFSMA